MTPSQDASPPLPAPTEAPSGRGASLAPLAIGAVAVAALAATAVANRRLAQRAERDNPPLGRFVEVDGVRLHVLERGEGSPLVLLHGNGSLVEDFLSSGLLDEAARTHRVLAFDRPGFGHSERPRGTIWTADAQADLIAGALVKLGVDRATVLGHSWGCSVAVALARSRPDLVGALVLASGYYYPTARADVVGPSLMSLPVVGDLVSQTVAPLLSRAIWPLVMRKIFGPAPVPAKFAGFPKEMALRPSQLRASAAETALLIPDAALAPDYRSLKMPVAIVAGEEDRLVDIDAQSARLHAELAQSTFDRVPGAGHMIHQTATPAVMAAIHRVAAPGPAGAVNLAA